MYSDLVNILKTVADKVNPIGAFYHGRVSDVNLNTPSLPFPQIRFSPVTIVVDRNIDTVSNCMLTFIFQDSPNESEDGRLDILYQADLLARQFKLELENEYPVTNYRIEPFIQLFSAVTSGVIVSFGISYKSKYCDL